LHLDSLFRESDVFIGTPMQASGNYFDSKVLQKYTEKYFKRFADPKPIIDSSIDNSCKMIIVIPCHNEPDLIGTLESLSACEQVNDIVEVLVVVNEEVGSGESEVESRKWEVERQNRKTIVDFRFWVQNRKPEIVNLKFHIIEALDMPTKTAGVGLGRKIGMDEALRRFSSINRNGTIICLDADCKVSNNYLTAIDQYFVKSDAGIGVMNFEHQYEKEKDKNLKDGIINYELFLRYYVEGLRQAKFPNAIHTIGSCMLVKAATYAKHGGMNKRKAGEDFYFLHKIKPHEKFVMVNKATVYPSCRTSDRVPFGTGKAQQDWLNKADKTYLTYDPRVFEDLKMLNESIEPLFRLDFDKWKVQMPNSIQDFFRTHGYSEKVNLIKSNCKTLEQFEKQFYVWFDGFLCLKFVHFVRDNFYSNVPLTRVSSQITGTISDQPIDLLKAYRDNDS